VTLKPKLIPAPPATYMVIYTHTDEIFYQPVLAYRLTESRREVVTNYEEDGDFDANHLGFHCLDYYAHGLMDVNGRVFCGRYLFDNVDQFRAFCRDYFDGVVTPREETVCDE
jgi:hypothetical protein